MEYILIHTPRGIIPPEMLSPAIEMGKNLVAKPGDFVHGGKLIASYAARNKSLIVCIWDAPSIEALCPLVEQLDLGGWDTDVMPAETFPAHLERTEKAFKAFKAMKK